MRLHIREWGFGGSSFPGGGASSGRAVLRIGIFLLLLSAAAFNWPKFFAYLFAIITGLFGLGLTLTALSLWKRRRASKPTPHNPEDGTWEEVN